MSSVLPPDNHVHTEWSWDAPAEASMVRSCEQALAVGVPAVAFTDHLDFTAGTDGDQIAAEHIDPRPYARMHVLDVPGYLAAVHECRQRYPDLRILTGAEIGEAHLWAASARAVVAGAGFDRILGSLHAIPFNGKLTAADALFRRDFRGHQTRELLGQRDLSMAEADKIIGKAIHQPGLGYVQLPDEKVRPALIQGGMSEGMADAILEMAAALNSGYMRALEPRSPQNTTPTSYETFVAEEYAPRYGQDWSTAA